MENIYSFKVSNLIFGYDKKKILNNIGFELKSGDIAAISGPNGVGKTTLFKILSNYIQVKDDFNIYINNKIIETNSSKNYLLFIENAPSFIENLNYKENLEIMKFLWKKDSSYIDDVITHLKYINFDTNNKNTVDTYSLGMRYKLALISYLCLDYPIYLLDEPLNSLDAETQLVIINLIKKLAQSGKIFLFSSHQKELIDILSNKTFTMKSGNIIGDDF